MNNLCKGLTFYKSIISDINELLKYIRNFSTMYNLIKNTYSLNSVVLDLYSKEYIANYQMATKLENMLVNQEVNSMVSFCQNNIVEGFSNEVICSETNAESYCSNYDNLVLLKSYNDKIIQKASYIRGQFVMNDNESDSMISNYSLIINEATTFSQELTEKINKVSETCGKNKAKKHFLIILTIIIIIFIIIMIIVIVLSLNKTKQINYVINKI